MGFLHPISDPLLISSCERQQLKLARSNSSLINAGFPLIMIYGYGYRVGPVFLVRGF